MVMSDGYLIAKKKKRCIYTAVYIGLSLFNHAKSAKMSELHELCRFPKRPVDSSYLEQLRFYLSNGVPATYTTEEVANFEAGRENAEIETTTTPLHLIMRHIPEDFTTEEEKHINSLIDELFSWGAGWNLTDFEDLTPGDILNNRNMNKTSFYERIVDAGVRAEILLRKINGGEIEFLSDLEDEEVEETDQSGNPITEEESPEDEAKLQEEAEERTKDEQVASSREAEKYEKIKEELMNDPANTQSTYLKTKLEYKDGALITKDNLDGVMMDWESELMKAGRDTIFKSLENVEDQDDIKEVNILNIGFGMGIIDTLIQEKQPTNHYISEAHPDVIQKLRDDGWFEKPNVHILEGRWQDTLPELLSKGVFFNGIYYDTYSEHYSDMLDLYDLIVGLLKPSGVFSFFNGLGADRQVVYDVYKKIVEIDMNNYGLNVEYTELETPKYTGKDFDEQDESTWKGIKRAYWRCKTYYHPEIRFI